jgi:GNAT superfamily N-acetyltransferase
VCRLYCAGSNGRFDLFAVHPHQDAKTSGKSMAMSDSAQLHVRPLRAKDRAEWAEMWTDYLAFYKTTLPQEIYDSSFARMLGDDPRDFSGLVAEKGGRLLGLTHFVYHRNGWKIEDVCYLQDLYTRPEARGAGVGRALIEAVYNIAARDGAPSVYWMTQDFNETARKLYDRIGVLTPFIKYQRP